MRKDFEDEELLESAWKYTKKLVKKFIVGDIIELKWKGYTFIH